MNAPNTTHEQTQMEKELLAALGVWQEEAEKVLDDSQTIEEVSHKLGKL